MMFRIRRVRRALLALAGATVVLLGGAGAARAAAPAVVPDSVLVVGDSIVSQAAAAARYWAPPGSTVWVYGGRGSAPCDWDAGYRDPFSGSWYRFSQVVDRDHPAAVVLAFSGNPGFSGPGAGCVDNRAHYPLSALLASYQRSLVDLARYASARGARVYLDASPPRNPDTAPGAYRGADGSSLYGFNGVAPLDERYAAIAGSAEGRAHGWTYDTSAAAAVSDPALQWHLTEQCAAWDVYDGNCGAGVQVQVRAGGFDSIHLDTRGAGGTRYGMAVVRRPLADEGYSA